jgi:CheY-like chemotaxis protein
MTAARIIEAVGSLLWPLLAAVVVIRVAPHVPGIAADLRRAMRTRAFTVKVGGVELTMEEATEQLRRQVTDLQDQVAGQLAARVPPSPGAGPAGDELGGGPARAPAGAPGGPGRPTVLWVDDHPEDHALELAKLHDDGVEVLQARSTFEAMDVLSLRRGVHAVVTDLGRDEDGEYRTHAGLALLRQLGEAELDLPVAVYTSRERVVLDRQDALDAGAKVVTASPTELLAVLRRLLAAPLPAPGLGGPATPPPRRPARPGPRP